jgi:hypothetical protein
MPLQTGCTTNASAKRFSVANTDASLFCWSTHALEKSACSGGICAKSVLAQMQPKAIDRKYQSKRQFARQMPAQNLRKL